MGIIELFEKFMAWTVGVVPKLIKANAVSRDEIIDVISDLAAELQDGLNLLAIYLKGAKYIDDLPSLETYIGGAQNALFKYHSEFKICRGLRKLKDRFKRAFDAVPASVSVGQKQEVEDLLNEMEIDERLIMDELRDLWPRLQKVSSQDDAVTAIRTVIDRELDAIAKKQKMIGEIARKIIDSI